LTIESNGVDLKRTMEFSGGGVLLVDYKEMERPWSLAVLGCLNFG